MYKYATSDEYSNTLLFQKCYTLIYEYNILDQKHFDFKNFLDFNFKGSKTHYVDAKVYQFLYQSLSRTLYVPGLNVKLNLNSFVVPCSKKYGQVIQF